MNFPIDYMFRLAARGGAGLSCDETGVALGAADLASLQVDARGRRRCEVRPPSDVGRILKAAYGPQPDAVVQRLHRGLSRTARWLEACDLGRAGIEAVMLGFPDLTPAAMAKLAEIADLQKRGAPWEGELRLPLGQAGGGQWTAGEGEGVAAPAPIKPAVPAAGALSPTAGKPIASPVASVSGDPSGATLDDGVYYFDVDRPSVFPTALPPEIEGEDEEAAGLGAGRRAEAERERPFLTSRLPAEINTVEELFSRLQEHPGQVAPLDSPEQFGVAAYADEVGAAGEAYIYAKLKAETKAIDPHYNDQDLFPEGGFASLGEADRTRLIDDVLLDRAAALYKIDKDPRQLQIETLRVLRKTVDHYYAEAIEKYDAKRLDGRPTREVAIGNYVDQETRRDLQRLFKEKGIPYGRDQGIAINSRDYDTSQPGKPTYRLPDLRMGDPRTDGPPPGEARIGNLSIDWTISQKKPTDAQIQAFFNADSKPKGVVIVMPSQRYAAGAYYIPRAAALKGK